MKKLTFVLPFTLAAILPGFAVAQTFSTVTGTESIVGGGSGDYGSFEWRDNGVMIAKGTGTLPVSGLLSSDQGEGTRFLWYPKKAALRAGSVSGTAWNESNIGQGSIALGTNSQASGLDAVALGSSTASGTRSFAVGSGASASGYCSIAMGNGSGTWATGDNSFAQGLWNTSSGYGSLALGGVARTASGLFSTSLGGNASGAYSFSAGDYNSNARASYAFVIGRFNVGGMYDNNNGNAADDGDTQWIPADPLFEIGNGREGTQANNWQPVRSNALTVYKDGNATFQGVVRVAAGGDIPMFVP